VDAVDAVNNDKKQSSSQRILTQWQAYVLGLYT